MLPPPPLTVSDAPISDPQDNWLLGRERTRMILNKVLLLCAVTGLVVCAYNLWAYDFQWANTGGALLALLSAASYQRVRQGHLHQGMQILVWGFTFITVILCFVVSGVRTPALYAIPALCVAATWLVGSRTAIGVFMTISLALSGIVVAEHWGFSVEGMPRTSLGYVLIILPSILLALLVTIGAVASLNGQLTRVTELTQTQQSQL